MITLQVAFLVCFWCVLSVPLQDDGCKNKKCKVCDSHTNLTRAGKCEECKVAEEKATCLCCEQVVRKEDKGLQCEECLRWYQVLCQGVDEAWYSKMQEEKDVL